jgi:hypothetical protein
VHLRHLRRDRRLHRRQHPLLSGPGPLPVLALPRLLRARRWVEDLPRGAARARRRRGGRRARGGRGGHVHAEALRVLHRDAGRPHRAPARRPGCHPPRQRRPSHRRQLLCGRTAVEPRDRAHAPLHHRGGRRRVRGRRRGRLGRDPHPALPHLPVNGCRLADKNLGAAPPPVIAGILFLLRLGRHAPSERARALFAPRRLARGEARGQLLKDLGPQGRGAARVRAGQNVPRL